jgi:hypothetical protein
MEGAIGAAIWIVALVVAVAAMRRKRGSRRRGGVGSAAAGAMDGLLNQEKRNAIEVIVEQRAAARDPEDKDGHLPDLAKPR